MHLVQVGGEGNGGDKEREGMGGGEETQSKSPYKITCFAVRK